MKLNCLRPHIIIFSSFICPVIIINHLQSVSHSLLSSLLLPGYCVSLLVLLLGHLCLFLLICQIIMPVVKRHRFFSGRKTEEILVCAFYILSSYHHIIVSVYCQQELACAIIIISSHQNTIFSLFRSRLSHCLITECIFSSSPDYQIAQPVSYAPLYIDAHLFPSIASSH